MSVVLVVDDEAAVLQILCDVVEDLGHEVVQASNGHEALTLARARRPGLIVTDHMMPSLSGVELCREIRQDPELKDIPVLLLSGVLTCGIPEAQAFLAKPFELSDFERIVRQTLQQKGSDGVATPPKKTDLTDQLELGLQEIRGSLLAARNKLQDPQPSHPDLAQAEQQLSRTEAQVAILLDSIWSARPPTSLRLETLDVGLLVGAVLTEWKNRCGNCEFSFVTAAETIALPADAFRLRQLIEILIFNAVLANRGAHSVDVLIESAPEVVHVQVTGSLTPPHAVEARVIDGARVSRDLAFADHLARLHGGTLTLPAAGEGARFSLRLPRSVT